MGSVRLDDPTADEFRAAMAAAYVAAGLAAPKAAELAARHQFDLGRFGEWGHGGDDTACYVFVTERGRRKVRVFPQSRRRVLGPAFKALVEAAP